MGGQVDPLVVQMCFGVLERLREADGARAGYFVDLFDGGLLWFVLRGRFHDLP